MANLIYDIACSQDGFIAEEDGSVGRFLFEGDHVEAYQKRLSAYGSVIMGRRTYESGFQWGLKPGDKPYPGMTNVVISRNMRLPATSEVSIVRNNIADAVRTAKLEADRDIYLCGGGELASHLLAADCIDRIILKLNPIVLGRGVHMFGGKTSARQIKLVSSVAHRSGVVTATYDVMASPS